MDVSVALEGLNKAQREAVAAPPGNILVLAGAGSGKTRALTRRIAWYIHTGQAEPYDILAVTFTNKAATEMRNRVETLLQQSTSDLWIGTFHRIAHRFLRAHWQVAGLPQSFQILDRGDQLREVKRAVVDLGLDPEIYSPKDAQWFINKCKSERLRPQDIDLPEYPEQQRRRKRELINIYQAYQQTCDHAGLVDFDELLLRAYELFRDKDSLLAHYQQRFRHLLVDEFQDINELKYDWLRRLAGQDNYMFAVGDDDQSIYGFRGANAGFMKRFRKEFSKVTEFRLEQNYRSTANILKAANALIANNEARLGKDLWTEGEAGAKLELYAAYNEYEEARFVVEQIRDAKMRDGIDYQNNAILYRVNALSRVLEETLNQAGVPYRVVGGLRFYERMEIKDALAYVRLAALPHDNAAFERIVNTPVRGIGSSSVEELRNRARASGASLWQTSQEAVAQVRLRSRRGLSALEGFLDLLQNMAQTLRDKPLDAAVDLIIQDSGLLKHYEKEGREKAQIRAENLEELVQAAADFEAWFKTNKEHLGESGLLSAFLSHAALEAGDPEADAVDDEIQLMTLHAAKGLEFQQVYMVGMEEGVFPHWRSLDKAENLEEERRLCYVGMTRAMSKLTLSRALSRRLYSAESTPMPSRFLKEIPAQLIESDEPDDAVAPDFLSAASDADSSAPFHLQQRVRHAKFGVGTVLNLEGQGSHARVQVIFDTVGAKWLVLAYANLTAL